MATHTQGRLLAGLLAPAALAAAGCGGSSATSTDHDAGVPHEVDGGHDVTTGDDARA